jgi:hypothetical protein
MLNSNTVITEMGGALLSPESPDAAPKLIGSMLLVRAETLADVKKKIESDIYWTSDVVSMSCLALDVLG